MKKLIVHRPGMVAYREALSFQMACVARLQQARRGGAGSPPCEGHLILLRHPPVITVGRGGRHEHILAPRERLLRQGVEVLQASRGGDVTYHGPGQIVGYPILALDERGRDVHRYLRDLEEVIIRCLADFGILAGRREGLTGVWVGRRAKIAAIGVAISRWVSYHGFALNVAPDLSHFEYIVPCGIREGSVTSMEKLLGRRPDESQVESRLVARFGEVFGFDEIEERADLALGTCAVGAPPALG